MATVARISVGVVVSLFAALFSAFWVGLFSSVVIGTLANLVAPSFGVRQPVLDHLGSPAAEILMGSIVVLTVGVGAATGIYAFLRWEREWRE